MKYTVFSLFPEIIDAFFSTSIMAKAVERKVISYRSINIRDYALDKHHKCDDEPYGGGAGMLMIPEPVGNAFSAAGIEPKEKDTPMSGTGASGKKTRLVYVSPSGKPLTQKLAKELAASDELILLCGRYEGIDQRIIDRYVDDEISVGDYVLSSGEVAALVIIDATYRLIDGVIRAESLEEESFSHGLLEYPQYTRPEIYDTLRVPDILLSGHHEHIRRWRLKKRVEKTLQNRPDVIARGMDSGIYNSETMELISELKDRYNRQETTIDSEGDIHE